MRELVLGMTLAVALASVAAERTKGDPSLWKNNKSLWGEQKVFAMTNYNAEGCSAMMVEGEKYQKRETRFFAYWALPEGASSAQKVPGIVLVHGGGGSAIASWVRTWNRRGYAAIAMDYCGSLPFGGDPAIGGRFRHKYSGPQGWGQYWLANEPLTDQWPYHAIAAIIRSHSFLRTRPEVDPKRVGITGISWGGFLTASVIDIDDRFAFAAPVYGTGFLYDHSGMTKQMKAYNETGKRWDELWDPRHFLPAADLPVLWSVGATDHAFRLDSLQRSYDLMKRKPQLAIRKQMWHNHPPEGDPAEITQFANHYAFGKPNLPVFTLAEVRNGRLRVAWEPNGRKVKAAKLVHTKSTDPDWPKRKYEEQTVPVTGDTAACAVPAGAVLYWMNIETADGFISSSRHFTREDLSK